ncbi:hypothetical protein JTB14_001874 [Gonioctena quinquepunctata]|nr:hypothetical protein JTB14_001874 [Gonioctena quinquepunctata]
MVISLLTHLHDEGKDITFIWVPSNTGIHSYESADKSAREGTETNSIDINMTKHTDLKWYVKSLIQESWQNEWCNIIKENVNRWQPPISLPRNDLTRIHRLRIGQTLSTHEHILRGEEPQDCNECGKLSFSM